MASTSIRSLQPNLLPPAPEGADKNWSYTAVRYNQNELPGLLPPSNNLLPSERKQLRELEMQKAQETATLSAYDRAEKRKAKGGLGNSLKAKLGPRWTNLKTHPRPVREDIPTKREERRFNKRFNTPVYERLIYASRTTKLLTGTMQILGKIYISENYFGFRESKIQPRVGQRNKVQFLLPITDIMNVSKGVTLREFRPGQLPEFRVLDTHASHADALFIYTKDSLVHRFCGFWTSQTFEDTYTVLDRQWRLRTSKPVADLFGAEKNKIADNATLSQVKAPALPVKSTNVAYSSLPVASSSSTTLSTTTTAVSSTATAVSTLSSTWIPEGSNTLIQSQPMKMPFLNDISGFDSTRLNHINPPVSRAYFGSVREGESSQIRMTNKPAYTWRTIDSSYLSGDLKDDIRFFNGSRLRHVEPLVRQWKPTSDDLKRRGIAPRGTGVPTLSKNLSNGSFLVSEYITPAVQNSGMQTTMESLPQQSLPSNLLADIRQASPLEHVTIKDNSSFKLSEQPASGSAQRTLPANLLGEIRSNCIMKNSIGNSKRFVHLENIPSVFRLGRPLQSSIYANAPTNTTYSYQKQTPISTAPLSIDIVSVNTVPVLAPTGFSDKTFDAKWQPEKRVVDQLASEQLASQGSKTDLSAGTA